LITDGRTGVTLNAPPPFFERRGHKNINIFHKSMEECLCERGAFIQRTTVFKAPVSTFQHFKVPVKECADPAETGTNHPSQVLEHRICHTVNTPLPVPLYTIISFRIILSEKTRSSLVVEIKPR